MDSTDFIVLAIGVTILIAAALLSFMAGTRKGIQQVKTDYKDSVSLRGLSQPSRDFVIQTVARRHIWEDTRGENKHLYRRVHCD